MALTEGFALRARLYQNPNVRALLSLMISEIPLLSAVPDLIYKARFPVLEKKLSLSPDEIGNLLKQLADSGVLKREVASTIIVCPFCSSFRLLVYPECPTCRSRELTKNVVYEHIPCGQIGLEQFFRVKEKLMCQRCNREFKELGVDYRIAGIIYRCGKCVRSFDTPSFECYCQECGKSFSLIDANLSYLHTYSLNEALKDEILRHVVSLEPIRRVLVELGFEVQVPGRLKGSSGIMQSFDLVARYPGVTARYAVIDLGSGTVPPENVLSLFARSADVKPYKTILIAVPQLSEEARSLVSVYKIECIERDSIEEAAETLKEIL